MLSRRYVRVELIVACYAVLHQVDGSEIRIDTMQMPVVRPAESEYAKRQLHQAVRTVVYAAGQKFGVIETVEQVENAIHNCVDGK